MASGSQLRVFLAGRVAVEANGHVIDEARFPGRQGRLLFAYLVAERGRAVPRDELAEALWENAPPATWEKALTVIASKLRGLLTDSGIDGATALSGAFGCYRLELPEGTWVDVIAAANAARERGARARCGRPGQGEGRRHAGGIAHRAALAARRRRSVGGAEAPRADPGPCARADRPCRRRACAPATPRRR